MKKLISAMLLCCGTAALASEPQTGTGETNGYVLVWQELFDADELNPLRWDIEVNGSGGGNNELQYYTDRPENVRLGDDGEGNGCLILTARRENYLGRNFTSGRINSKNRTAFTHGKIEASIKLPSTANGLWPAFWMMGNDYDAIGWPRCGEIDIMEMGNAQGISSGLQNCFFNGACHWGPQWPQASYANSLARSYSLQDGQFHLFTVIWDEESITMYVDLDRYPTQNPYYRLNCPIDDPDNEWSPGNYFHKDNFILFNLAVGGDFTGIHQADAVTALNEANSNEASMFVNYVKVYQTGLLSDNLDCIDPGDAIESGIERPLLASADYKIDYDGSAIMTDAPSLTLYSMCGSPVCTTDTGRIATSGLAPGLYLASCENVSRKILVIK